jgi:hypothetical protein
MTYGADEVGFQRFWKDRNGLRRFRCPRWCAGRSGPLAALEGSYMPLDKVVLVLRLLAEGNSIRSAERISGLDRNTSMKLLVSAGERCAKLTGRMPVNVAVGDVECDEIRRRGRTSPWLTPRRSRRPPKNLPESSRP